MTESPRLEPGWYSSESAPDRLRYWDGEKWTEHTAPASPTPPPSAGPGTLTIARGVAIGVAVVLVALFVLWRIAAADDGVDCATKNADRALAGQPALDCD